MKRILCELPNASKEINGIKFSEDKGQMVSEEVKDEIADRFASIPGYKVVKVKTSAEKKAQAAAEKKAQAAADKKAAEEKAAAETK